MRTLLNLPLEIATSLLFAASIGICAGVVVISYTHKLGHGLAVAPVVFIIASAVFGYALWRTYRPEKPPRRPQRPRIRAGHAAAR